jgi:hypothetical protein
MTIDLNEAYKEVVLNEKLSGEIKDHRTELWGGVYKGKKFSKDYSIQNFGKEIESLNQLVVGAKYNIYVENFDQWFCEFKLKAVGINQYKFVLDVSNETKVLSAKELYNWLKKGYVINYNNN